jgi:hypothetical protein
MGLVLAFKRVARPYRESPRRFIGKNMNAFSFYAIGLFTGLLHGATPEFHQKTMYVSMLTFVALIMLRKWAGKEIACQ